MRNPKAPDLSSVLCKDRSFSLNFRVLSLTFPNEVYQVVKHRIIFASSNLRLLDVVIQFIEMNTTRKMIDTFRDEVHLRIEFHNLESKKELIARRTVTLLLAMN